MKRRATHMMSLLFLLVLASGMIYEPVLAQERGRTTGRTERARKPSEQSTPKARTDQKPAENQRRSRSDARRGSSSREEARRPQARQRSSTPSQRQSRPTAESNRRSNSSEARNRSSRSEANRRAQNRQPEARDRSTNQRGRSAPEARRRTPETRQPQARDRGTNNRGTNNRVERGRTSPEAGRRTPQARQPQARDRGTDNRAERGRTSSEARRRTPQPRQPEARDRTNRQGANNGRSGNAGRSPRQPNVGNRGTRQGVDRRGPVRQESQARRRSGSDRYKRNVPVINHRNRRSTPVYVDPYYGGRKRTTRYRYRYQKPVYHHWRPRVHVEVWWPWKYRYTRHWKPRYRYRQNVYVEVAWGNRRSHRRNVALDLRTRYHSEVTYANDDYAVVEINIDAIEIYQNGRFYGEVDRFPRQLRKIEAVVYRDGYVEFDKDIFLVGDPRVGFEMIATQHYGDGYILDAYEYGHDFYVGKVNLRRGRVDLTRHSRLFDPYRQNGYTPIALLPDDAHQLVDFGYESVSYNHYGGNRYDPYYGGSYDDSAGYDYNPQYQQYSQNRTAPYTSPQIQSAPYTAPSLNAQRQFQTKQGVDIQFKREGQLERIN